MHAPHTHDMQICDSFISSASFSLTNRYHHMADLRELAAKHFVETLELLAGELEDEEEGKMTPMDHAKAWHREMSAPIDTTHVKYAKAVTRIIQEPAPTYLCVEYRDADALRGMELLDEYGLEMPKPDASDAARGRYWTGLRMLCRYAQVALAVEPARVPTKQDIQRNIEQHRQSRKAPRFGENMSMASAFQNGMASLGEAVGGDEGTGLAARIRALSGNALRDVCTEWSEGVSGDVETHVKARDADALRVCAWPVLTTEEAAALVHALERDAEGTWKCLDQILCFSRVHKHIPSAMLSKIEACAQQLAGDISSGAQSLDSLDLAKLGESVLSECSEEDMAQVASNLAALLPTLGTLQGAMHT